ncbi:hypothetical protein QE152_g9333 [Popillia japonica]|uniref:Uncharacterized protein n=1 Tax=Popillia japonica TaxID=7064 RepID=A0AAW1LYQ3_POPJA
MEEKMGKLDTKVENLEKRNNLIIVGYEPQTSNNYELIHELENFNREVLRVETKIRNANKTTGPARSRWKTGKKQLRY